MTKICYANSFHVLYIIQEHVLTHEERGIDMKKVYSMLVIILMLMMFVGCPEAGLSLNGAGEIEVGLDNLLFLQLSHVINNSGTPEIVFLFQEPSEIGANGYYLEYAGHLGDDPGWTRYQDGGSDLFIQSEIHGSDIEIRPVDDQHYFYRLVVEGGEYDGMGSNSIRAETSYSTAKFTFSGMDESIHPPEIIAPSVGYKMIASFGIDSIATNQAETIDLDYQWYRLDPSDFSLVTAIDSASGEIVVQDEDYDEAVEISYTTVAADHGYIIFLEVLEDPGESIVSGSVLRIPGTWIVQ